MMLPGLGTLKPWEPIQAIRLEDLGETGAQSIEFTLERPLAHIGSHSGHNKTQWVGSTEGSGPSCLIRSQVMSPQGPQEDLLAHPWRWNWGLVLGKSPSYPSPEGEKGNPAVGGFSHYSQWCLCSVLCTGSFVGMLDLQGQFDSLKQQPQQCHQPSSP